MMDYELWPKDLADTPLDLIGFRTSHTHEEGSAPGTVMIEIAAIIPGVAETSFQAFEMPTDVALNLSAQLIQNVHAAIFSTHEECEEEYRDD